MLLDIVQLSKRHTGRHLALAFEQVLKAFGIEDKVSVHDREMIENLPGIYGDPGSHLRQREQQRYYD